MQVTISVFAALKTYFNNELVLETTPNTTIEQLKDKLIELNPMAEPVMMRCRFAIADSFVSPDYVLYHEERVCVIPPSSGG
jgi:sulfur-carrier protein